jgi:hypothetical protein
MRTIGIIGTILFLFAALIGVAQSNIALLDRKVSLNFNKTSLTEALFIISETADFNLSYNSNILPSNEVINFNCQNKKLSQVFQEILPAEIEFKTSGNNVILLKKAEKELRKKDLIIDGKVIDSGSRLPLEYATVLDIYGSQSVLTDTSGNFKLQLTHKQPELVLSVSKIGYRDSSVFLTPESQKVIFNLQSIERTTEIQLSKIESLPIKNVEAHSLGKLVIAKPLIANSENIEGYTKRKFQVSLSPGTSTNLKIAGTVKNAASLNLIGGYNYGVSFLELGGVFNINRADVSGIQIAGATNLVGGKMSGAQLAGVVNRTKGKQIGAQVAGFANYNHADFFGYQLSCFSNMAKNFKGLQLTGVINKTDSLTGAQLSIAYNKSTQLDGVQLNSGMNVCENMNGVQVALAANLADSISGVQLSTLYNKSKEANGVQLSSGLNFSDNMKGVQVGIVNMTKQQSGFQLGIININDTSDGVSIGLVNIIKDKKLPRFGMAIKKSNKISENG